MMRNIGNTHRPPAAFLTARLGAEEQGTGVHESYTMAGERLLGLKADRS
jgi:hypothetical protein